MAPETGDRVSGLAADHALTRSVRDSAALLDAIRGGVSGDPYWAPVPERPYVEEVGADPGTLRIAFTTEAPRGSVVDPDCVQAVERAAALCQELGHRVEEASPQLDAAAFEQAFLGLFGAGVAASLDAIALRFGVAPSPEVYEPATWRLYERGAQMSASQ
jgi:amidase